MLRTPLSTLKELLKSVPVWTTKVCVSIQDIVGEKQVETDVYKGQVDDVVIEMIRADAAIQKVGSVFLCVYLRAPKGQRRAPLAHIVLVDVDPKP